MEKVIFAFLVVGLISVSATPAKLGIQCTIPSTISKIAPAGRAIYETSYGFQKTIRLFADETLRDEFNDILKDFVKRLDTYTTYSKSIDDQVSLAISVKPHPPPATYLQALANCEKPVKDKINAVLGSISIYTRGFQNNLYNPDICHCDEEGTVVCTSDATQAMLTQIPVIKEEFIEKDKSVFSAYVRASGCIWKVILNTH